MLLLIEINRNVIATFGYTNCLN